jgi:hypothetical protein
MQVSQEHPLGTGADDEACGAATKTTLSSKFFWMPFDCKTFQDDRGAVLAHALASILFQCTPNSSYTICQAARQTPRLQHILFAKRLFSTFVLDWQHLAASPP